MTVEMKIEAARQEEQAAQDEAARFVAKAQAAMVRRDYDDATWYFDRASEAHGRADQAFNRRLVLESDKLSHVPLSVQIGTLLAYKQERVGKAVAV